MTRREPGPGNGAQDVSSMTVATGRTRYDRRLSDKVLAAFNHAFGLGELDAADRLRQILCDLEARFAPEGEDRRRHRPLDDADRWTGFVAARQHYRAVCDAEPADAAAVEAGLAEMKAAYRQWSGT